MKAFSSPEWIIIIHNLGNALRHGQCKDMPRLMQIDALCSTQNDGAEKGHQIPMKDMAFKISKGIMVWLSSERNDSTLALAIFQKMSDQVKAD